MALIGRTNVGKSALYNRLVGKREALVCKEVNTTRDRREGRVFFVLLLRIHNLYDRDVSQDYNSI